MGTIYLSTATRTKLIDVGFNTIFNGGWIGVYSGVQPDGADLAPTGTLLARIQPPTGVQFTRAGMFAMKEPTQTWTLQGIATGTAGWFRLHGPGYDPGFVSGIHSRLDGPCSALSAPQQGLILPDEVLSITPATNRDIDHFLFSF